MLNPRTTAALIFGVSECPKAPSLQPLPQCANSASAFHTYLQDRIGLEDQQILNLFDSTKYAPEQLEEINTWLSQTLKGPVTDLLIFYTGHGGFSRADQSYFLAINKTSETNEGGTSIRYADLALCIKHHAARSRRYIFLDCCYAAAAVPKHQSNLDQLVLRKITDEMPSSGTALFCSSSAKLASIAPSSSTHTMFSHALLRILYEGIAGKAAFLTLEDIAQRARQIVVEDFRDDIVRPELHVPDQQKGNPATIPLFPNPIGDVSAEALEHRATSTGGWKRATATIRSELTKPRMIGLASGISSAILMTNFPFPGGRAIPQMGPPICLSVALFFALRHAHSPSQLIKLAISVFIAWSLAWEFVYVVMDNLAFAGAIWSEVVASLIGSSIVLAADRGIRWRRAKISSSASVILMLSLPFVGLTLAMELARLFFRTISVEAISYSVMFAPWQILLVELLRAEATIGNAPGRALSCIPRALYVLLLILSTLPFVIGEAPLTFVNGLISGAPAEFHLVNTPKTESGPDGRRLFVELRVVKTTRHPLFCRVQLRDDDTQGLIEEDSENTSLRVDSTFSEFQASFSISSRTEPLNLSIRQHCTGTLTDWTTPWTALVAPTRRTP